MPVLPVVTSENDVKNKSPETKKEKVKTEAQLEKEREDMISIVMEMVQEDSA